MAFTGQRRALEDIDANEEPTKEERLLPQSAKTIQPHSGGLDLSVTLSVINRLSDALSPKSKIFDAELKRTYDVSDPASGRLTIYRSRPAAAVLPAAGIHAAGTVQHPSSQPREIIMAATDTHADSRRPAAAVGSQDLRGMR